MSEYSTTCERVYTRWAELKRSRESWMSHYQELSMVFSPRSGMFLSTDSSNSNPNSGEKKHQDIFDNSPLRSVDVATAGLMAGMTSPARPWYRLGTPDAKINERYDVKVWLQDVEEQMRTIMSQSNTYRAFRRIYEELSIYGTGASLMLFDFKDVVRHYPLTVGEYAIALDERETVDTLYRKFDMTVQQLVSKFGYKNCSAHVQNMYDQRNLLAWIPVIHGIEPRRERDPFKLDNLNMPYASFYMEVGANENKFLQMSGFKDFNAITPRWKINAHDAYGEAPAMRALGDAKSLQQEQLRKAQAIDYQTQPPLQVPSSLVDAVQKGPGGITVVDSIQDGIKPAWEVELNLQYLLQDIIDVRQRIAAALFEDIFLMFTTTRRGVQPPTAEEIAAQQEEKLLMIGPVLENLQDEMLSPVIEKTFAYMLENGLIPPPPPALHGMPLTIKFVSVLAQAQRLIGLGGIDRMVGTIVGLTQIKPDAGDKLDTDKLIDYYADALGVDPDLIVANEQVALIRQQRAQSQAAAQNAALAEQASKATKALGDTNPEQAMQSAQVMKSLTGL